MRLVMRASIFNGSSPPPAALPDVQRYEGGCVRLESAVLGVRCPMSLQLIEIDGVAATRRDGETPNAPTVP